MKTIILADSGSTKIDWRIISDQEVKTIFTTGFNPYYQADDDFKKIVKEDLLPHVTGQVHSIYFYGTGVSSERNVQTITNVFKENFKSVQVVELAWDLLGTARALCGTSAGIACILGTGSNSCEFDGKNIVGNIANLGWILADEASGCAIGKRFIFDYYRKKMPADLAKKVKDTYNLQLDDTLEKVYSGQKPGTFVAGFCKFVGENIKEEYCTNLVKDCFRQFFTEVISRYPSYQKSPIHFTGSIAYHFTDLLKEVAAEYKTTVGKILKGPMDALVEYHQKNV